LPASSASFPASAAPASSGRPCHLSSWKSPRGQSGFGMFYGFDGAFANNRRELFHQLLDDRIGLNRLLRRSLPLRTPPRRGLGRSLLPRPFQFDHQLQRSAVILVERIVQTPLLRCVEQGAL